LYDPRRFIFHAPLKERIMKKLLILGSGAGGTIVAAKMAKSLGDDWKITVIDRDWKHHYQAGWLFVPFGVYTMADCMKPKSDFIPSGVDFVQDTIVGWWLRWASARS
jgi:sulfide:quinone oxidoreductase